MTATLTSTSNSGSPPGKTAQKRITAGYILGFLAAAISFYISAVLSTFRPDIVGWSLYNADSLWIEAYLRDWLIRGVDMQSWITAPAPNYFPEMLLYAVFRFTTGSVPWAFLGFALAKAVLYAAVIVALLGILTNLTRTSRLWLSLLCVSGMLLSVRLIDTRLNGTGWLDFYQLFVPTAHGGAFANGMLATLLILGWLRNPERDVRRLGLLFALSVVASLSDRLYTAWFSIPAICALGIFVLLRRLSWRSAGPAACLLLLADYLGRQLFVWGSPLQVLSYAPSPRAGWIPVIESFSSLLFSSDWYRRFVGLSYLSLLLVAGRGVVLALRPRKGARGPSPAEPDNARLFLAVLGAFVLPASLLAQSFIDRPGIQYLTGGDLASLFLWIALLVTTGRGMWLWTRVWFHCIAMAGLVVWVGISAALSPSPLARMLVVPTPYTELVACLDSYSPALGGGAGYADYWQARGVNLFSRAGLRVDPAAGPQLAVFSAFSSQDVLEERRHTFVITNTPSNLPAILETDIIGTHGQPNRRFECAGYPVLVYEIGLEKSKPSSMFRVSSKGLGADAGVDLSLTRNLGFTVAGRWTDGAIESTGKSGALLYGPYTDLPPGQYLIRWMGRASPGGPDFLGTIDVAYDSGAVVVARSDVARKLPAQSGEGELAAIQFALDRETPLVEFRFFVNEGAVVLIEEVTVERVN